MINSNQTRQAGDRRSSVDPKVQELFQKLLIDENDSNMNIETQLKTTNAQLSNVVYSIERLEKEIKEAANIRRQCYNPNVYFPSDSLLDTKPKATSNSSDLTDEFISRAQLQWKKVKERSKTEEEAKIKKAAENRENLNIQIEKTKKAFDELEKLVKAGPKYKFHFMSGFGNIMHIEIVEIGCYVVITSRGYLEMWSVHDGSSKLLKIAQIYPDCPQITKVVKLDITENEKNYMFANKDYYDKRYTDIKAEIEKELAQLENERLRQDKIRETTDSTVYDSADSLSRTNQIDDIEPESSIKPNPYEYYVAMIKRMKSKSTLQLGTIESAGANLDTRSNTTNAYQYFIGCINGDGMVVNLTVTKNQKTGEIVGIFNCSNPDAWYSFLNHAFEPCFNLPKTFDHTIITKRSLSRHSLTFVSYFAPTNEIVSVVYSSTPMMSSLDSKSLTTEPLKTDATIPNDQVTVTGFAVPELTMSWTCNVHDFEARAVREGLIKEDDIGGFDSNPVSALTVDNVYQRIYIALKNGFLVQLKLEYNNSFWKVTSLKEGGDKRIADAKRKTAPTESVRVDQSRKFRKNLNESQIKCIVESVFGIESHSQSSSAARLEMVQETKQEISSNERTQITAGRRAGKTNNLRLINEREASTAGIDTVEVVTSISPIHLQSQSQSDQWLLLGCLDGTIRCIYVDNKDASTEINSIEIGNSRPNDQVKRPNGKEYCYYATETQEDDALISVSVNAFVMHGSMGLGIGLCGDGTFTVLELDRKRVLSETRSLLPDSADYDSNAKMPSLPSSPLVYTATPKYSKFSLCPSSKLTATSRPSPPSSSYTEMPRAVTPRTANQPSRFHSFSALSLQTSDHQAIRPSGEQEDRGNEEVFPASSVTKSNRKSVYILSLEEKLVALASGNEWSLGFGLQLTQHPYSVRRDDFDSWAYCNRFYSRVPGRTGLQQFQIH
ncbi:hypothetical protein BKA69DRAFT_1122805 [Paraphysoderma sedebokerense]|nr:hypothetical protein BKA69DRAFT_1122805 [Paraphysoderma sedebokerense]